MTEVSERDLHDVYHLLALLESDAAAVVAKRATDEELRELQALHQDLENAAGDRALFFTINEAFHRRLLELAENRWRDQMVNDVRKVMKLNRYHSLLKSGRLQESLSEHRLLVEALVQRNSTLAAQRMQAHFQNGLEAAA